jgi:hypothetical protein
MARPPIHRVTFSELRDVFNTHVLPQIRRSELLEVIASEGTPNPAAEEPPGTRSQRVEYWGTDGGRLVKVAVIHRYLRPDGSLGASGLPDPKRVLHAGTLYAPHVQPPSADTGRPRAA